MQMSEFLKGLSADDINGAFATIMEEERDPEVDFRAVLDREVQEYPMIAELLDSLRSLANQQEQPNVVAIQRLHGMLMLARALVVLAERDQLH